MPWPGGREGAGGGAPFPGKRLVPPGDPGEAPAEELPNRSPASEAEEGSSGLPSEAGERKKEKPEEVRRTAGLRMPKGRRTTTALSPGRRRPRWVPRACLSRRAPPLKGGGGRRGRGEAGEGAGGLRSPPAEEHQTLRAASSGLLRRERRRRCFPQPGSLGWLPGPPRKELAGMSRTSAEIRAGTGAGTGAGGPPPCSAAVGSPAGVFCRHLVLSRRAAAPSPQPSSRLLAPLPLPRSPSARSPT